MDDGSSKSKIAPLYPRDQKRLEKKESEQIVMFQSSASDATLSSLDAKALLLVVSQEKTGSKLLE